jgi:hypothetical protein
MKGEIMAKITQLIIGQNLTLLEHRLLAPRAADEAVASTPGPGLPAGVDTSGKGEPGGAGLTGTASGEEATLKLGTPHHVSRVTVRRRPDGTLFLVLEE